MHKNLEWLRKFIFAAGGLAKLVEHLVVGDDNLYCGVYKKKDWRNVFDMLGIPKIVNGGLRVIFVVGSDRQRTV